MRYFFFWKWSVFHADYESDIEIYDGGKDFEAASKTIEKNRKNSYRVEYLKNTTFVSKVLWWKYSMQTGLDILHEWEQTESRTKSYLHLQVGSGTGQIKGQNDLKSKK